MIIKVEKAGLVTHNDLNCRLRTAFENDIGEKFYLEVSSGFVNTKGSESRYMVINFLFRIDNEEDAKLSYSKDLHEKYVRSYQNKHVDYCEENLVKLFNDLGCKKVTLKFCDYYKDKEYCPFEKVDGQYWLGNELKNKEPKQLSLF